jgi:hypothetical protein
MSLLNVLSSIIKTKSLTKKEKLKKMYMLVRDERDDLDKEEAYDFCVYYYEKKMKQNKESSDSFFYK